MPDVKAQRSSTSVHVLPHGDTALSISCFQPVYGMTELSSVFSTKFGDSLEQTTTTVGFVADHTEVSP